MSLLEKGIDDVLLLLHVLFALFQPVALTLDVDDGAMMEHTVEDSGGDGDVGKDFVPLRKSFVRGEDCRDLLIPSGDELKEQVRSLNIHREIADLVDDEQLVFTQGFELVRQSVLEMSLFELLNQGVAVDVIGGETVPCGHHPERRG